MARVTCDLVNKPISITPFGVDTEILTPLDKRRDANGGDGVVRIGTIKLSTPNMGSANSSVPSVGSMMSGLIPSFVSGAAAQTRIPSRFWPAVLSRTVRWSFAVPLIILRLEMPWAVWTSLPPYRLDSESFGVAIIEAGACGLPAVVSDADGPAEVVEDGVTGLIVPRGDVIASATALMQLVDDVELRRRMGRAGRDHVVETYSWEHSLDLMEQAYRDTIDDAARQHCSGRHGG
ncbi:dolichol-phosphate mannosyltransferase [Cutibacterium acnes JCM 18909]|nr:dolichol-phosphate mannosyltransferase [Cutibacterium acnes JCM 18909]